MLCVGRLNRITVQQCFVQSRNYNPSSKANREGKKWRAQFKLTSHINHHPALMEGADYTFLNGKPTPYGVRQYQRMMDQQSLATQIYEAVGEMNFAVERCKRLEHEEKAKIKSILDKKLKPKGGTT